MKKIILLLTITTGIQFLSNGQNIIHDGEFEFLNIPEGNYQVEITYIGYEKQTQEVKEGLEPSPR